MTALVDVTDASPVVTTKVSLTPPIVNVALIVAEGIGDDVKLTVTVSPLLTVPFAEVYALPLIEYSPPVMDIAVAVLIPDTVMVFDVTTALGATPVRSVKKN